MVVTYVEAKKGTRMDELIQNSVTSYAYSFNYVNEMINYFIQAYFIFEMQFVQIFLQYRGSNELVQRLVKAKTKRNIIMSIYIISYTVNAFFFIRTNLFHIDDIHMPKIALMLTYTFFGLTNSMTKLVLSYLLCMSTIYFVREKQH